MQLKGGGDCGLEDNNDPRMAPKLAEVRLAKTPAKHGQMGQVRCLSTSTLKLDVDGLVAR